MRNELLRTEGNTSTHSALSITSFGTSSGMSNISFKTFAQFCSRSFSFFCAFTGKASVRIQITKVAVIKAAAARLYERTFLDFIGSPLTKPLVWSVPLASTKVLRKSRKDAALHVLARD